MVTKQNLQNEKLSKSLKKHHSISREKYKIYKDLVLKSKDKNKYTYSDFRKKETPLDDMIISYEVSFQASYRGEKGGFFIAPVTFLVFGLKGDEETIQRKTMEMVVTSRGKSTGNMFNSGMAGAVENNLDINIKPRGLEESQRKPKLQDYEDIFLGGFVVKELDTNLKFKNHKNREGIMRLDIRHFM